MKHIEIWVPIIDDNIRLVYLHKSKLELAYFDRNLMPLDGTTVDINNDDLAYVRTELKVRT